MAPVVQSRKSKEVGSKLLELCYELANCVSIGVVFDVDLRKGISPVFICFCKGIADEK